jgi:hypothetical protein
MTPQQLEDAYRRLAKRLCALGPILRRSWHASPVLALELLGMNLDFRRKTLRLEEEARSRAIG